MRYLIAVRDSVAAGTRGAMDWMEVPSHFMEHFARDDRTLQLLQRDRMPRHSAAVTQPQTPFAALDLQKQVLTICVELVSGRGDAVCPAAN